MTNAVETFSKVVLLILLAVFFMQLLHGTGSQWVLSKFKAAKA